MIFVTAPLLCRLIAMLATIALSSLKIALLVLLTSCGLPSVTNIDLEPPRPEVAGFYDGATATIELTIRGRYTPEQFPKFNGFNIYFGSNNNSSHILKRVLYLSARNELPSITVPHSDLAQTTITLTNNFLFRLTASSDEQDLSDENLASTNDEAIKPITVNERFYFIIRPLNDYKESSSSETLRIYIPQLDTITLTFSTDNPSATFSTPVESAATPANSSIFTLTITSNQSAFTLQPQNQNIRSFSAYGGNTEKGCYDHRTLDEAAEAQFDIANRLLLPSYYYEFINDAANNTNYYYRLYVTSLDPSAGTVTLCSAYYINRP